LRRDKTGFRQLPTATPWRPGLFHDLTLKRSTVSVVWGNDPEERLGLPVP